MAHMVFDTRFKAEMEGLDEPPFDSDFGQKIYKNVSKKSWGEWVERQKMLLNEYRLQPWTREAQEFLVEQMNEFFLMYDDVRVLDSPRDAVLEFCQSTYEVGAELGKWDRVNLERPA